MLWLSGILKNIKRKVVKVRKIILFPTALQAEALRRLLGAYRYIYNRCICMFTNYNKTTRSTYYINSPDPKKYKIEN